MKQKNWLRNLFLMGACLLAFVFSCKNPEEPNSKTTEQFVVTFAQPTEGGTLKAKLGNADFATGNKADKDQTVEFTVELTSDYKVEKWEVNNTDKTSEATGPNKEKLSVKITEATTVKVTLKKENTGSTTEKFTVNFEQPTEGGTLKAKLGNADFTTGSQADKDQTVEFTVELTSDY
ncbi:MAG: hypothetical protein ACTTKH_04395, partial [Treponema sp.]